MPMAALSLVVAMMLAPTVLPQETPASAPREMRASDRDYRWFDPIIDLRQMIDAMYVDKADSAEMQQAALAAMLESLGDPYSIYVPPSAERSFDKSLRGHYVGIGAEVDMPDDRLRIVSPLEDSPALEAGIMPGDVVLEIDGTSTESKSVDECIGPPHGRTGKHRQDPRPPRGRPRGGVSRRATRDLGEDREGLPPGHDAERPEVDAHARCRERHRVRAGHAVHRHHGRRPSPRPRRRDRRRREVVRHRPPLQRRRLPRLGHRDRRLLPRRRENRRGPRPRRPATRSEPGVAHVGSPRPAERPRDPDRRPRQRIERLRERSARRGRSPSGSAACRAARTRRGC
jgi:hypothetical protein